MRFNAAAVISTALLAGAAQAHGDHGAQKVVKDASTAAEASAKSVLNAATEAAQSVASSASSVAHAALPTFTPTNIKADFLEQFTDDWEKRWKPSHAKKDMKGADVEEEWEYVGEWAVEEPKIFKGMEGDKGLVVKNAAAHHAISAKFPKAIDNKGKTLVVQYEVKLQNGLECGGAYLKLLRENKALHQEEFTNSSPYVVMFGPDKCGHTNKVHFIVNHKNPKTGEYEEKHLKSPPTARVGKTTELYTLIVKPDNTFVIKQNGEVVKEGNMLEDFTPAFNPPAEIEDPNDSKPDTWVDTARIPDPSATKPEDWDEEAPFEIVDEDATMPEDWLVDEPSVIPDPEAQKPEDWDDEEDGDWMAPMVPNPKCEDASGCGPWTKPMKKNPAYKGKWTAPLVDNPEYKGPWAPRKIKNPAYFEDKHPANLEPMGAIGFEIWTMQNDIMFDNIYIGHSIEDAEKLANETFVVKKTAEEALELLTKPKDSEKKKSPLDLSFKENPVNYVKEKINFFFTIAKQDPIGAIRFVPEVAIGLLLGALTVLGVLIGLLTSATAPKAKQQIQQKKAEKDIKKKTEAAQAVHEVAVGTAVDAAQNQEAAMRQPVQQVAIGTGLDASQSQEATRRQTRSTGQVQDTGYVREL